MIFNIFLLSFLFLSGINAILTKLEKDKLLYLHQQARDALNSPDMKPLSWDNALADAAQVNVYFIYKIIYYIFIFTLIKIIKNKKKVFPFLK